MNKIIILLSTLFFGKRTNGEPINLEYGVMAPCSTCEPECCPEEFKWYSEFRVGCLHGKQHVYLEC